MSEGLQEKAMLDQTDIDEEAKKIFLDDLRQDELIEEKKRKLVEDEQKLQEQEQRDWDQLVAKISTEEKKAKEEYDKKLDEIREIYNTPPTAGEYRKSEQEIIKSVMEKRIAREPLTVWQGISLFFKTLFKPYKYEQKLMRRYQEQNYQKNYHEPIKVPEAIVMNRCMVSKKKKATEQINKLDATFDKFRKNAVKNVKKMRDKILTNRKNRDEANSYKIMQYDGEYTQKRLTTNEKMHNYIDKKLDTTLKPLDGLLNLNSIQKPEYDLDFGLS